MVAMLLLNAISGLTASTAYYFEVYELREDFGLAK